MNVLITGFTPDESPQVVMAQVVMDQVVMAQVVMAQVVKAQVVKAQVVMAQAFTPDKSPQLEIRINVSSPSGAYSFTVEGSRGYRALPDRIAEADIRGVDASVYLRGELRLTFARDGRLCGP